MNFLQNIDAQTADGVVTVLKNDQAPAGTHPDVNCNEKINHGFTDYELDEKKIDLSGIIIDPSNAVVTFNGEKVDLSDWCNGMVHNGAVQNGHLTSEQAHDNYQGGARPYTAEVTNTGMPNKVVF